MLTLRASSYFFNRGRILGGGASRPPLKISRLTDAMILKFWPVIDIDKQRWFAKFQFGHLFGWYFTDQNVNLSKMTYLLIGSVNLAEICSWRLICRIKVTSGKKNWSHGYLVLCRPVCKIHMDPPPELGNYWSFWLEILTSDRYWQSGTVCKISV